MLWSVIKWPGEVRSAPSGSPGDAGRFGFLFLNNSDMGKPEMSSRLKAGLSVGTVIAFILTIIVSGTGCGCGCCCPCCCDCCCDEDYECCCSCSGWNPVTVTWDGSSPETWTGGCGDSLDIVYIDPGTPITVEPSVVCSPDCLPSYEWEVVKTSGAAEGPWSGVDLPVTFSPTGAGTFQISMGAACDGTPCPECLIILNVGAVSACHCSEWTPVDITYWPTPDIFFTDSASCGDTFTITPALYGHSISFTATAECVDCAVAWPDYTFEVIGPGGTILHSGTGNVATFSRALVDAYASYQVVFRANCGDVACSPCALTVERSCCIGLYDCDIMDIAVSPDGTIHVITEDCGAVYRSTDGGYTFTAVAMPTWFTSPARAITAAPDNTVFLTDSNPGGNQVFISSDGGITWAPLGNPALGSGCTITDIAVSPTWYGGIGELAIAVADNGAGDTAAGDVKVWGHGGVLTWVSIPGLAGTHDYMAVAFSPMYPIDASIILVGVTESAAVDYQVSVNFALTVLPTVNVVSGTTTDFSQPAAGSSILYASIALPDDFNASTIITRTSFVGVASNILQATDDVYQVIPSSGIGMVTDMNVLGSATSVGIRSLGFRGTATTGLLVAGAHATRDVWSTTSSPALPVWTAADPPPCGERDVVVVRGPDWLTWYAGTSGLGSCFSISNDNAGSFN